MANINKNVNIKVNFNDSSAKKGQAGIKKRQQEIKKSTNLLNNQLIKLKKLRDNANDPKKVYKYNQSIEKTRKLINKLKTQSKQLGKSSDSLWKRMSTGSKLVAGIITGFVIKSIVNFGKKLVMAAGKFEQLNIAFETFLGSKAEATALINELERFAAATPFLTDQINNAAKSLLAFGFEADEITPTLKMLGDISAGTGKDLGELGIIFGQIRGAGRLMGQDLLQLINAGFNPLQIISKKTGRSMRDLKDDMAKGLISFDMVTDAFKSATSEGGRFYNLTEKQSKSFLGVVSTLQSNISILVRKLGEVLLPYMLKLVTKLNEFVNNEKSVRKLQVAFITLLDVLKLILLPFIKIASLLKETKTYEDRLFDKKRIEGYNKAKEKYNELTKKGLINSKVLGENYSYYVSQLEKVKNKYKDIDERNKIAVGLRNKELGLLEGKIDFLEEIIIKQDNETKVAKKGIKEKIDNEIKAAKVKKDLIEKLLKYEKNTINELLGMSVEKLEKELKSYEENAEKRKKLIDELLTYNIASDEQLVGKTDAQLKELLKLYKDNAEKIKQAWKSAVSGMSSILGKLNPEAKKTFDNITNIITSFAEGDIVGALAGVANMIIDIFQIAEKRAEQAADFAIEQMEKVELVRADLAIKALEDEKEKALESIEIQRTKELELLAILEETELKKFELIDENYDNMNESTQKYYDLLMLKEKEKYDLMTEDEKNEYDIKNKYLKEKAIAEKKHLDDKLAADKQYTDAKAKLESDYNAQIQNAEKERAKVQLKIALARVETDRREAESKINKEYWAPWDRDKKIAAWQEMQGMYNDIKASLESQLGMIGGLQHGGIIPGYGGGDKVTRKLEPGEAVLPKEWQVNPIPFFNSLLAMRGQTQSMSNNITNMSNDKKVEIQNVNVYPNDKQDVLDFFLDLAENTNTTIFTPKA